MTSKLGQGWIIFKYEPFTPLGPSKIPFSELPAPAGNWVFSAAEVYHYHHHFDSNTSILCVLPLQSHPALCKPMDYSPPGSSVRGTLPARILEWVALPQGIFSTQGLNSHLFCFLHWQAGSLPLEPPGKQAHWTEVTASHQIPVESNSPSHTQPLSFPETQLLL